MSNKKSTKIAALIALLAIIGSVLGTGVLVLFETFSNQNKASNISQEQLQELLKNYSGSTTASTGITVTSSGEIQSLSGNTLTGTTK